jgi:hypothetical protein
MMIKPKGTPNSHKRINAMVLSFQVSVKRRREPGLTGARCGPRAIAGFDNA